MSQPSDEINLLDIFKSLKKNIQSIFFQSIKFLIKNTLLLLGTSLLGGVTGFVYFKFTPPVYESDIVLASPYIPNDLCSEIVNGLSDQVKDKSFDLVAQQLGIDESDAEKIRSFNYFNFDDRLAERYKNRDTVVLDVPFRIRVATTDNSVFNKLTPGITAIFETNALAKLKKQIKLDNNNRLQQKLEDEQKQLDTLKATISRHLLPRGTSAGFVFGQPLDPLHAYERSVSIFKEELELIENTRLNSSIANVLIEFQIREKPSFPTRIIILWGAIAGFALGNFFLLLKSLKNSIND